MLGKSQTFFEGPESQSTLIASEKSSSEAVYSQSAKEFLAILGYRATQAVDSQTSIGEVRETTRRVGAVIDFPLEVKNYQSRARWSHADGEVLMIEPPLKDEHFNIFKKWCLANCVPNDAGPNFHDYRKIRDSL